MEYIFLSLKNALGSQNFDLRDFGNLPREYLTLRKAW